MWIVKEFFKKLPIFIKCFYVLFLVWICFTDFPKNVWWNFFSWQTTTIYIEQKPIVILSFLCGLASFLFFPTTTVNQFIIAFALFILSTTASFLSFAKTVNFPLWVHNYNIRFLVTIFILDLINLSFKPSNKHLYKRHRKK